MAKKVKGYIEIIQDNIRSAKTIHVGAVGISKRKRLVRHRAYTKATGQMIGFDYDPKKVAVAHSGGFDEIFVADVTSKDDIDWIIKKHGQFPHVIMTEVIEHIGNLSLALDGVNRLMTKKGRLYITTPNAENINKIKKVSPDHICWFCKQTLGTLLGRSGLEIVETYEHKNTLFVIAEKK
jgi:2-polyprenyl-3-methyl-5-hydroxy-6-metoxy-1,4-benzoquinol methylase